MEKANSVEAGTVGAGVVREGRWLAAEHARRGTHSAESLGRRGWCEMWLETGRPSSFRIVQLQARSPDCTLGAAGSP